MFHRKAARVFAGILTAVSVLVLVACSSSAASEQVDPTPVEGTTSQHPSAMDLPSAEDFGDPGAEGCEPPSPILLGEVMGTPRAAGNSAYGLLMGRFRDSVLLMDEEPFKIVTRVTGAGELEVRIQDPSEAQRELDWGPEDHGEASSNYVRPGNEWGMGILFDQPGCWHLEMVLDDVPVAEFWLPVSEP